MVRTKTYLVYVLPSFTHNILVLFTMVPVVVVHRVPYAGYT